MRTYRLWMTVLLVNGWMASIAAAQDPVAKGEGAADVESGRDAKISTQLRAQLAEWLKANADMATERELLSRLAADMDERLAKGQNVRIVFDGALIKEGGGPQGEGRYVITWAGKLHAFTITMEQCRATGLAPRTADATMMDSVEASSAWDPPLYSLAQLEIDNASALTGATPIVGRVTCKATGAGGGDKGGVLRVMYRSERTSRVSFQQFEALPPDGVFTFSLSSVNSEEGDVDFGPVAVLVDVLTASGSIIGEGVVACDAAGTIVNVLPDPDGYMRAALEFMQQSLDVLASVQDEASAEQSFDTFRKLARRNESLVAVMDRLGPLQAEEEARLTAKYEPQMLELAAKMEQEIARLEQAPYAGEAYFAKFQEAMRAK